ncbi:AcrB/AcrD/AcrF family protein [Limnospira platensis C1]|nr:AcrB/AcrD/AcrF family protein [Arthrospira platensis C1]
MITYTIAIHYTVLCVLCKGCIQTEAVGLAPEEVEAQITVPIESAVNGLPSVTLVRSSSKVGLSMVHVVFDQEADIYQARQAVTERLQQVMSQLPQGIHPPEISPLVSPLGTILQYAFTVNGQGETSLMDLRRLVDVTLRNQILSVPGVSQVTIYGGMNGKNRFWSIRNCCDRAKSPSMKSRQQPGEPIPTLPEVFS